MTTQLLNALPAATWNRLGVNHAPVSLPSIPREGFGQSHTTVSLPLPDVQVICPGLGHLTSGAGEKLDSFLRENANYRLHLAARKTISEPILIEHMLDHTHPNALTHITLQARPGSSVTVIEVIRGGVPGGLHGGLTEIHAEADAKVTVIQLQMLEDCASSWTAFAAQTARNAEVQLFRGVLGGSLALCGSRGELTGTGSGFQVQNIYLGGGDSNLDFNDVAVHAGQDTRSEIHAAGVLDGSCQKILRGTIVFRKGAVHGVGHESEDVLLLSPTVRNRTAPLILCGEEQVEGQHAASIGRLDESMLYYMASRGINEQEAKRLVALAKFAPVLDVLPPDLKCEADAFIERRVSI